MTFRNLSKCPCCSEETEIFLWYTNTYSKFYCKKCGEKLCFIKANYFSQIRFCLQVLVGIALLVILVSQYSELTNNSFLKFGILILALILGVLVELFSTKYALKVGAIKKYES